MICPQWIVLRLLGKELMDYHDAEIYHFLRYGWPVGYHLPTPPTSVDQNHMSAVQHPTHVQHFIKTELSHNAVIGPFTYVIP